MTIFNNAVAITGGIGSGKSMALHILKVAGYKTFSCDDVTKELYEKQSVIQLIREHFPDCVYDSEKSQINKKALSQIVFNDKNELIKLNNLLIPLIMEEIKNRISGEKGIVFVEIPLLFECGYQKNFSKVIVVTRDINQRIASVMKRSDMSPEQVTERMKNQIDYDKTDLSAYTVIDNSSSVISFQVKVLSCAKQFEKQI